MKNNFLHHYLFNKNIKVFLVLLISFYLIAFFCDCAEIARKCSAGSIKYNLNFLLISFYRTLNIITEIIPYLLLISTSIIFAKLNSTEELTIIKTNGFSIFQIARPFITFASTIGCINLFIIHPVSIYTMKKNIVLEHIYLGESLDKNDSKSNIWIEQSNYEQNANLLIYIHNIEKHNLNNINIYFIDKINHSFKNHIYAKSAKIKNGYWLLSNGAETSTTTTKFTKKIFKTNLNAEDMNLYYKNPIMLNFAEIYHILQLRRDKNLPCNIHSFYLNFLFSKILFCIITALFPIIFFFKHHRYSSKWLNVFFITSFAFVANFFVNTIRSIGVNSDLPAIITCWTPIIIALFATIFALDKTEKLS